jgi:hypothetical protein
MKEFILDELGNKPKKAKEIKYIITKNNCWECVSHPKSDGNYLLGKEQEDNVDCIDIFGKYIIIKLYLKIW